MILVTRTPKKGLPIVGNLRMVGARMMEPPVLARLDMSKYLNAGARHLAIIPTHLQDPYLGIQ